MRAPVRPMFYQRTSDGGMSVEHRKERSNLTIHRHTDTPAFRILSDYFSALVLSFILCVLVRVCVCG